MQVYCFEFILFSDRASILSHQIQFVLPNMVPNEHYVNSQEEVLYEEIHVHELSQQTQLNSATNPILIHPKHYSNDEYVVMSSVDSPTTIQQTSRYSVEPTSLFSPNLARNSY